MTHSLSYVLLCRLGQVMVLLIDLWILLFINVIILRNRYLLHVLISNTLTIAHHSQRHRLNLLINKLTIGSRSCHPILDLCVRQTRSWRNQCLLIAVKLNVIIVYFFKAEGWLSMHAQLIIHF